MSLGRLLRRASSKASDLLTFNPGAGGSSARSGLDGEIIFSKNNVCVHPAEPLPGLGEHHPGTLLPLCPPPPVSGSLLGGGECAFLNVSRKSEQVFLFDHRRRHIIAYLC